uniref:ATPase, P-type (Transporting), HAD superfamily, subfamily IC n=1 Tax=Candidatus Kentrum sp. LPFa TaxID=2126335 RepID=A0A450Y3U0_9GAMM|nr:MAG: ATPase, P-type (transporting), HAD superfamily, subfamily IC [Candidatus Kentron sp. LPFa]VFK36213.1 MAG: ATPase, P-type (transporting), HAD superfamily, subfamily IC [Candidatus Kentron sp. LPFa]
MFFHGSKVSRNQPQTLETLRAESDKFRKGMPDNMINRRFAIASGALGISVFVQFLYPPLMFLSVIAHMYAALPYYKRTYKLLLLKKINIDSMLTILSIGCIGLGHLVLANIGLVLAFLSLKLVQKVKKESDEHLFDIFKDIPHAVLIRIDDTEVSVPFNDLKPHDYVIVGAGETIPVDGIIIEGMASIDQHVLTGEARPVEKEVGEEIFASSGLFQLIFNVRPFEGGPDFI